MTPSVWHGATVDGGTEAGTREIVPWDRGFAALGWPANAATEDQSRDVPLWLSDDGSTWQVSKEPIRLPSRTKMTKDLVAFDEVLMAFGSVGRRILVWRSEDGQPHEAPVSTFPKQPSRKDGLGTMCAEHWKVYVKGLTADRKARAGSGDTPAPAETTPTAGRPAKATTKRERRRTPMAHVPSASDLEVAQAATLIAEVDALPGPEHVKRVGDDDAQAALETVNGSRHEMPAETPRGEAIDRGAGEADAA